MYYGSFSVNSGSTYSATPRKFTSKKDAKETMRKIAWGNCPRGNDGKWTVKNDDGDIVADGLIRR